MSFWELFRFRNEQNIIPFILLPIAEYPAEYAEYEFFWEIFGGKSNAAARARRPASGWKSSSSDVTSAVSIPFSE